MLLLGLEISTKPRVLTSLALIYTSLFLATQTIAYQLHRLIQSLRSCLRTLQASSFYRLYGLLYVQEKELDDACLPDHLLVFFSVTFSIGRFNRVG